MLILHFIPAAKSTQQIYYFSANSEHLSCGPGIVLEKVKDAPTGFMDEEDEWVTAPKYKVAWQDKQSVDWYWEDTISHYKEVHRGEQ